jgi:hypothetical protein
MIPAQRDGRGGDQACAIRLPLFDRRACPMIDALVRNARRVCLIDRRTRRAASALARKRAAEFLRADLIRSETR